MKFPVLCKIQEGESIPGFISHIVESNNYSSIGCVTEFLGITTDKDFSTNGFHKLNTGKFNIKLLSDLSENSQNSLKRSLITLKTIKPSSKSDSQFVTKYWRICPDCIKNNIPHQKLWMYSFVTACPDHKVRLTDRCEKCATLLRTSKPISAFCPNCDALLTSSPGSKAEIECAKVIKKATSGNSSESIDSILGRLMISLYMSSSSSLRARYRISPQLKTVNDMGLLIQKLWKVAKSDKSLSQHIFILNQELKSKWSYLPYASTLLENRVKEFGVSLPSQETIALNETPLYNIQDEWKVPTEIAATAMGVSDSILRKLLKFGFIESNLFSQVKGESLSGATRLISLDEINSFVCKLHLHARPKHEYTRSNLSLIVKLDITQVLNDVLNNKVSLYSDGSSHINGLYVPYIETTSFKKRSQLPKNVLSTKDAALQLNTNNDSIAHLIKLGHLTTALTGNKNRHHIDSNSVTDFNKNYILAGSLAKEIKNSAASGPSFKIIRVVSTYLLSSRTLQVDLEHKL